MAAPAYRQFAVLVAEYLTWVFEPTGEPCGTGREARAVLRAIQEELPALGLGYGGEALPEEGAETPATRHGGPSET